MTFIINDNGNNREMTINEIEAYKAFSEALEQYKQEAEREMSLKQAIRAAALAKLGLTAEQIAVLFE